MTTRSRNSPLSKLRTKLTTAAIQSPEFKDALHEALKEIRSAAKRAPNEATIESTFERVLYVLLREVGIEFAPDKEVSVETRRHVGRGRTDSRIGSLIIEYKHRDVLKTAKGREKALHQLSNYSEAISASTASPVKGVLTDGECYLELEAKAGSILSQTGFQDLSAPNLLRLVRAVHSLGLTALTPENLIRDFARPDFEGEIFEAARVLESQLENAKESAKTTMLRLEWEGLFKLAHDDQSQQKRIEERRRILTEIFRKRIPTPEAEYRALFSLHTSYAISIKLMAFRIACDLHFGSRKYNYRDFQSATDITLRGFCEHLEDGDVFRELGFLNLLEGDFFSWYTDKAQWTPAIAESVRRLLGVLSRYEDVEAVFSTDTALDLFRELYQACVPQVVRASFGEFHTPFWLATRVLEAARPSGQWSALDPCCGSGTFLVAAISRIRTELADQPNEVILEGILHRVAGFDLNPLCVLTTRVSYFLHIANLLPENVVDLVIPVYLGDASYVPEIRVLDGVQCLSYRLRTLKGELCISLPASMAAKAETFITTMREMEYHVRELDSSSALSLLTKATPCDQQLPAVLDELKSMCNQLVELESKGWNGIWARILSNFFATACLQRVDCIIGNPPWIDWKNLPAGYREKIKSLCIDRGLFSGAGRTGGINLNVCALIANVTIINWLAEGGYLSFLMPKELSNQASYEGWRDKGPGKGRAIIEMQDWSEAGHPFDPVKEDFMTFVIGPAGHRAEALPVTTFIRKKGVRSPAKQWKSAKEAAECLQVEKRFAKQVTPRSTAFTIAASEQELEEIALCAGECSYIGREGIEFYPQELLLLRYLGPGPRAGLVRVENIQVQKSKHRVPRRELILESEFLFPLVKGPNIGSFSLAESPLLVPFPYDETDPHRPIDEVALRVRAKHLHEFYRSNKEVIQAQTKFSDKIRGENPGAYYGLARTGPYSFKDTYVAFRDNTRWCASVVRPARTPWGEIKRMVFQNHSVSMCERASGDGFISLMEAHYICAILNAPLVERFILQSSDNRSFKIRPPVFLPPFDPSNSLHRRISRLSRLAHARPAMIEKIRIQIGSLYSRLCRSR